MPRDRAVITNFWRAGDSQLLRLPPPLAEPFSRFRLRIAQTQAPADCAIFPQCTIASQPDTFWVGFAGVHRVAYALLLATLQGCALVAPFPTFAAHITSPALQRLCSRASGREGLSCYYLPISTCANASSAAHTKPRTLPVKVIINGNISSLLDDVARLDGLHSELLVMSALMGWVMRPQPELEAAIHDYAAAAGLGGGAAIRTLAMHVRHGDKAGVAASALGGEAWRVSGGTFALWARRLGAMYGATRTIYMSDDLGLIDALSQTDYSNHADGHGSGSHDFFRLVPAPIHCNPLHTRFGLFGIGFAGKHLLRLRRREESGRHRAASEAPTSSVAERLDGCGATEYADDGVQLFAGVALLAQCVAFLGLFVSNVDRTIAELMAAVRFPPVVHDPLNDLYRAEFEGEQVWHASIGGIRRPIADERLVGGVTAAERAEEAVHGKLGYPLSLPRLHALLVNKTSWGTDRMDRGSGGALSVRVPRNVLSHHRATSKRPIRLQIRASGAVALIGSTRPEDLEAMLWRLSPLFSQARVPIGVTMTV